MLPQTESAYLQIHDLWSSYGDFTALQEVNLTMKKGEFLTLLGPSGSGKSTLLMIIGGFVKASRGSIFIDGKDVLARPPNKREIGFVFQSYALFPHLTVEGNVLFPLKLRAINVTEARDRVLQALDRVGLSKLADRKIDTLSGGQRQRVALARAVVAEPCVVLMDEPLSALDKTLREEMQAEIRELHDRLGFTTIYVTHDQREAMAMADRIAIMDLGRIQQIDTPERIYRRPRSAFVASFMGRTNLLPLDWLLNENPSIAALGGTGHVGKTHAVLRAEDIRLDLAGPSPATVHFTGVVQRVTFQGENWLWHVGLPSGVTACAIISDSDHRRHGAVTVGSSVRLVAARTSLCFVSDHV